MQLNPTLAAGLLAFAVAAFAATARLGRLSPEAALARRYWLAIIMLFLAAFAELLAGLRHRADGAVGAWLKGVGLYGDRRPAQTVALAIAVVLAARLAFRVVMRAPLKSLSLASGASAVLIVLFLTEAISLHATDAVLYRPLGPVMLVGWLWLACGAVVVVASLWRR